MPQNKKKQFIEEFVICNFKADMIILRSSECFRQSMWRLGGFEL